MKTNARDYDLAKALVGNRPGSFIGITLRKIGKTRIDPVTKKETIFGNETVRVTLISGFDYGTLVKKSQDILNGLSMADVLAECTQKRLVDPKTKAVADLEVVQHAFQELHESYAKSLSDEVSKETSEVIPAMGPLVVDGKVIPGVRVYQGAGKPDDVGVIYVYGLKVAEKTLKDASAGKWETKSALKTQVKDLIRAKLPVSRFTSYKLDTNFILRAGGRVVSRMNLERTDKAAPETAVLDDLLTEIKD